MHQRLRRYRTNPGLTIVELLVAIAALGLVGAVYLTTVGHGQQERLSGTVLSRSGPSSEVPLLFRRRSFTCATLAEAVNHFVVLGGDKATRELLALVPHDVEEPDLSNSISVAERIGWVCRILLIPRGHTPLRAPYYGGLDLPWNSMPLERWPLYPVVRSGRTYFVLSEGYSLDGLPEVPREYVRYCLANGNFRRVPVTVPTRDEAMRDAAALRRSVAWRAIKWRDSGPGFSYAMNESPRWRFIQDQAQSTMPRASPSPHQDRAVPRQIGPGSWRGMQSRQSKLRSRSARADERHITLRQPRLADRYLPPTK
jgi:hypothetical protein